MENFNNGFDSSLSFKGGNKSNNENELNPEMTNKIKSPRNKLFQSKNFMNPTISAQIKASVPRKKILGERNETLDTVEQIRLQRSSSFGSRSVENLGDSCLQPYDPVKNYLSPRPKFLRYDPDRRRKKILILQENDDDQVKISTYFNAGNNVPASDSCSQQKSVEEESVEEAQDVNNDEDKAEDDEGEEDEVEDDEEEMVEEDSCYSLKDFLKLLLVVVAVILTTQSICSMNSHPVSRTLESDWGVSDWNYGVHGLNFSEVRYGSVNVPDLLVGEFNEGDAYSNSYYSSDLSETHEEGVMVEDAKIDDHVHHDEVQIDDDSNVFIQDELLQGQDNIETETVYGLDDSDANESNPQLPYDTDLEITNDMEEEDQELDDLFEFRSSNLTPAIIFGHILILTSFSLVYCLNRKKSSASVTKPDEKEEFENPESMIIQKEELVTPFQNDTSKVYNIPSVELLGEFEFNEEITNNNTSTENYSTNSLIQTTADSFSQTIKKQRRKNAEVITPSSVRRSSRLITRSVMSP